jgi:hypothetical protein
VDGRGGEEGEEARKSRVLSSWGRFERGMVLDKTRGRRTGNWVRGIVIRKEMQRQSDGRPKRKCRERKRWGLFIGQARRCKTGAPITRTS